MGNPFDFDRDGRWSTPERALTHYGADPLVRAGGGGSGCRCVGCLSVLVGVAVLLFVLLM